MTPIAVTCNYAFELTPLRLPKVPQVRTRVPVDYRQIRPPQDKQVCDNPTLFPSQYKY